MEYAVLDISGDRAESLPISICNGAGVCVAEFGSDDRGEAFAVGGDSLLAVPDFEGELVGGQRWDEEAEQGVGHGRLRDGDAREQADGAPDDGESEDEVAVAAAQSCVPREVLFLGYEDVVWVMYISSGVVPAADDTLIFFTAPFELAGEAGDVGVGNRIPGHGGAPREVEQRGVEHLLEQRSLPGGRYRKVPQRDGRDEKPEKPDDRPHGSAGVR